MHSHVRNVCFYKRKSKHVGYVARRVPCLDPPVVNGNVLDSKSLIFYWKYNDSVMYRV